ncbi:hypothetical protein ACFQ45_05460 [Rhodanobacter aciditrophus]|uniref:DUF3570 domain-containing protein n=1 Tax=Rhodanobacter aciditrophus TaxID=1623218 RepID=A0ABW4B053_9GAMM
MLYYRDVCSLKVLCWAVIGCLSPLSFADSTSQPQKSLEPTLKSASQEWFLSTHEVISEKVSDWSNGLDSFFSGRRDKVANQSFVSMRFGSIIDEGDGVSGFFNLDTRIRLPNTENRLNLVIETDGDELTQDNRVSENEAGQNILQSARNTRVATALRYIKKEWNTNVDLGVLLDMPMDPFLRFKVAQSWKTGQWQWSQSESLFSYYSLGNGGRYSLKADRRINDTYSTGVDFGATYLDSDSQTYWRENLYLTHALNRDSKLRYQLSYLQYGWPNLTSDTVLYFVQYQKLLYENWLIGEVKPQIAHARDNDYEAALSLTLSLEVLLGQEYL